MTKQWKVSFAVSEEDYNRGKKLTRETNVSEELRKAAGYSDADLSNFEFEAGEVF